MTLSPGMAPLSGVAADVIKARPAAQWLAQIDFHRESQYADWISN